MFSSCGRDLYGYLRLKVIQEDKTMSEKKKCMKNEELCEEVTELSMEELEQVTGGAKVRQAIEVFEGVVAANITAEFGAKK